MSLGTWWRDRSGRAKAVTVLATLLIVQIGLCFGTDPIVSVSRAIFHAKPSTDPFEVLGLMMFEAMLCVVTLLALLVVPLFFRSQRAPQTLFGDSDKDQQ